MLKIRPGFTLIEMIAALTLTAIIGAAVTGLFISQSRFYDAQEKVGFARGVSLGALNIMMSEMRMVDRDNALAAIPTRTSVTIRVPYAFGAVCAVGLGGITFSRLPADTVAIAGASQAGYAYRGANGINHYVATTSITPRAATACTDLVPGVKTFPADSGGGVFEVPAASSASALTPGTPLFLYQVVTYEFRESVEVPGRIGLWRSVRHGDLDEELAAPFDTTAGFQFYVDDARGAEPLPPASLSRITGFELILDGVSERPSADGTFQRVPLTTSVFFRNRR
jgi:prepilin-type N-terminal cleavage/methylation domain-containing protein